ncbi:MAG: hypothetical protein VR69_17325 [Peptococcaceae bacterium BRH_c4b]|nr:MAG: hypothetical protein VR69_17325 [Peptococcaceae bacterium BRH_c4b]
MDDAYALINSALELRRRAGSMQLPEILVMGAVNSGKSTLINSLLKSHICPVDASPSTFLPVHFTAGDDFAAEVMVGGKARAVKDQTYLSDLIRKKISLKGSDRVVIRHPASILNWCSLVDTPGTGLSSETDRLLENLTTGRHPGEIIFLLHQRGIDAFAHGFLTRLKKAVPEGGKTISFWINVNTGHSDGTPLPEAREVVRRLFPGQSRVYLINTRNPNSMEILSLYMQTEMAGRVLKKMDKQLREMDTRMPGRLNKIVKTGDDGEFLQQFWDLYQEARSLLAAREAMDALPLVSGRINSMLEDYTRRLILLSNPSQAEPFKTGGKASPPPKLEELVERMAGDKALCRIIPAGRLKILKEKLMGEKYQIEVVGTFSSGKTTFLNALLGEPLLTAGDRATTACKLFLHHGPLQKAVVETMLQPEFKPVQKKEGKYRLVKEELDSLRALLTDRDIFSAIGDVEITLGNQLLRIHRDKLEDVLDETLSRFSAKENEDRSIVASLLPKFLSKQQRLQDNMPLTSVRLTFNNILRFVFDLSHPEERKKFAAITLPPYAAISEKVEVYHPSLPLKNAVFIDTPGLDSLPGHQQSKKPDYREKADISLVFLHGKHLTAGGQKPSSGQDAGPTGTDVYYVINFADTLDQLEREKASLFVRLKMPVRSGVQPLPYPRVFMISALQALQGEDEGFQRLVRQLTRAAAEKQHKLQAEVAESLKRTLLDTASRRSGPDRAMNGGKNRGDIIEKYLFEISRLDKYKAPEGNKAWKTPECLMKD